MAVSRINEAGLNVNQYGNRNLIINGAMNVAQRGTSFTTVANNTYTLDRFNYRKSNDGNVTITQDSSGPDGFSNSLKIDVTTADTSIAASQYSILEYNVEAQDLQRLGFGTSSAKNFTLSFYVKSNKTGTYAVNISQSDNSSKQATLNYTIDSADTWERKSLTFTGDTSGVINDDNGIGFLMYWWLAAGTTYTSGGSTSAAFQTYSNANAAAGHAVNLLDSTSNEWLITGVQLEVGDTATDFEHRTFADEMARCKRYFRRYGSDGSGSGENYIPVSEFGAMQDNYRLRANYLFDIEMRASPAVSFSTLTVVNKALDVSNNVTAVALAGQEYSRQAQSLLISTATVGSQIAGHTGWARVNNSDSGYLFFDAEL